MMSVLPELSTFFLRATDQKKKPFMRMDNDCVSLY